MTLHFRDLHDAACVRGLRVENLFLKPPRVPTRKLLRGWEYRACCHFSKKMVGLLTLTLNAVSVSSAAMRPNILVIVADDFG